MILIKPFVGDHFFTPVTHSNLSFTNTCFYTSTGFRQTLDLVHQLELIDAKTSTNMACGETYNHGENGFALSAGTGIELSYMKVPLINQ